MANDLAPSRRAAVDAFLERNRQRMATGGRLIFALDATASRQPTWDLAVENQSLMFAEAGRVGGLEIQLAYFRGDQFRVSEWTADAPTLAARMREISCRRGETQWGRVLEHVRQQHQQKPVSAAVCIGDCVEESQDGLYAAAAGLPRLIMVQDGGDPTAPVVFAELARRTNGAHFKLGSDSGRELRELLRGIGAYAAGGRTALEHLGTDSARALLTQLNGPSSRL
jgi:hypothetical protein